MKKIIAMMLIALSPLTYAIDLTNVTSSELEGILEDFSGNMVHSAATAASSSTVFGFQIGLVGGTIETPKIEENDAGTSSVPNGGLFASVDLPLGFGAEAIFTPIKLDDLEYNYTSIAAHWSKSFSFVDMKVRGFVTDSTISFSSDLGGGTSSNVDYEYSGYGLNISIGKSFLIVEPYIGLGYVSGESKLIANGIFDNGTTQNLAASGIDVDSTYFFAGASLNLLLVNAGIEFSNPYGNNRITGRVSFGF